MELILVRHGEVINKEDPNLTKLGREQVKILAKRLRKEKIDVIYSSDLKRTKQTAQAISKETKHRINYTSELREIPDEIIELPKSKWINDKQINKRFKEVKNFINKITKKPSDHTVLIIGHGRLNRLITSFLIKNDARRLFSFLQSHANITILTYGERRFSYKRSHLKRLMWSVKTWNNLEHLPKSIRTSVNREK